VANSTLGVANVDKCYQVPKNGSHNSKAGSNDIFVGATRRFDLFRNAWTSGYNRINGLNAIDPFENATPEWFSEVCEAKDSTYGDKSDLLSL